MRIERFIGSASRLSRCRHDNGQQQQQLRRDWLNAARIKYESLSDVLASIFHRPGTEDKRNGRITLGTPAVRTSRSQQFNDFVTNILRPNCS